MLEMFLNMFLLFLSDIFIIKSVQDFCSSCTVKQTFFPFVLGVYPRIFSSYFVSNRVAVSRKKKSMILSTFSEPRVLVTALSFARSSRLDPKRTWGTYCSSQRFTIFYKC